MDEVSPLEWAVRPFRKYADFTGRAPRAEYWWFYLATVVIQIPLTIIDERIAEWGPLSSLFSLAILLPWLAVSVRRLHDIDRTGWWLAAFFLPLFVVGMWAALATGANLQGTGLGPEPTGSILVGLIIAMVVILILAVVVLVFMVTSGTEGPNRFGPDPYGPDSLEEVFA
jgi:uncharacterized membrane protein YhaH (DUF805 family)